MKDVGWTPATWWWASIRQPFPNRRTSLYLGEPTLASPTCRDKAVAAVETLAGGESGMLAALTS